MNDSTLNKTIKPDVSVARRFLKLLNEEDEQFTFEIIEEPKPGDKSPAIQRFIGSFDEYQEKLVEANLQRFGVFVVVNSTDGKGRKKENISKVRALFVDLDGSPLEPILQVPLNPHIIIESSPGRFHAYWMIENIPLDKFEISQKLLAERFDGDVSVCDLPRLMRLPGFLHRKKGLFRSHIVTTSGAQPYSYENFQVAFQWNLIVKNQTCLTNIPIHTNQQNETLILGKLREYGLLKHLEDEEGRWCILCPWANEHSGSQTAHYFSKPNKNYSGEGFKCFHAHCQYRDIRSLRFFLGLNPIDGSEPLPLFREMPSPQMFPVEALGAILGRAAQEIYETVKAPLAIICQSLLASASLITQGHANIEIDGRIIALSLFFISVAESGERKSAVDDIALSAVFKWQSHLWSTYRLEKQKYDAELERWKNSNKQIKTQNSLENQSLPEPPISPIILIEEPTYEGLVKYLEYGQPSVGIFSDEGSRFLGGNAMSQENRLKTLAGLSSLWDAKKDKPISRIRSGDKSLALYGRRVALHLMIQESVYSNINEHSICESQGFLPRCLISYPESKVGSRPYVKSNPFNLPGVQSYLERCNLILDRIFPIAPKPAPQNQLELPSIHLSSEAYLAWRQFYDGLETKLGKGEVYHSVRRFGSKAAEHVLRLSGVLSVFENPSTTLIEKNHIERAVLIMDYYLYERTRLESYSSIDPILMTAQRVLDWVSNKQKKTILLKELYQCGPSEVRSKDKALAILRVLEEHGRVFPIPAHEIESGAKGKGWRII